jgi:endonuclease/exonuclease/phosphatase family metal-dependent hydrolase/regulation of enolase protein 1 (concanavalin A-like superfamily)
VWAVLCAAAGLLFPNDAQAGAVPSGWGAVDIGIVAATGSSTGSGGSFSVVGSGSDIWSSADAFQFSYRSLTGDGSIVAQVATLDYVQPWTKAGVMMRESLTRDSKHAFMLVSAGRGLAFQRRVTMAGESTSTSGGAGAAPSYVKLVRSGSTFSAYRSADGANWTLVGSESINMASTIYVGLAVTSHADGYLALGTFANVSVSSASGGGDTSAAGSLPSGWADGDIGSVGATGAASGSSGAFTVKGAGSDIWGYADAFRFAYQPMTGDATVVTQVTGVDYQNAWSKAGVMMRETLSTGSKHAMMVVSAGKGLAFQRRTSTDGASTNTSTYGSAPYFVKLARSGSTFSAYASPDGSNWTLVGSEAISMANTIYVGLAVTSHYYGVLANATFQNTSVTAGASSSGGSTGGGGGGGTGSGSGTTLKVLQWNTHHGGIGTDGVYNPDRIASWIASINPDVVSLNEVDDDYQVSAIVTALQSRTGATWNLSFSGRGNLALSRKSLASTSLCTYDPVYPRVSAQLSVTVNGRPIRLWSTHLAVDSATERISEIALLQGCALNWSEARIIAGDYNMQYGSGEYSVAATGYTDAWMAASSLGATLNYSGNCDGCTRNSRIDYVFSSGGASFLAVKSAQIIDTRDAYGYMPSDHKPLLVTYTVN